MGAVCASWVGDGVVLGLEMLVDGLQGAVRWGRGSRIGTVTLSA